MSERVQMIDEIRRLREENEKLRRVADVAKDVPFYPDPHPAQLKTTLDKLYEALKQLEGD